MAKSAAAVVAVVATAIAVTVRAQKACAGEGEAEDGENAAAEANVHAAPEGGQPTEPVLHTTVTEPVQATSFAPVEAAAPVVHEPVRAAEAVAPVSAMPAVQPIEPAVVAAAPAVEAAQAAIVAAPAETPAPVSTVVKASPLSVQSLQGMLTDAGMTWVHTDAQKLQAAQEEAARTVVAPRVPRERKPLPPIQQGPMILVETGRAPSGADQQ